MRKTILILMLCLLLPGVVEARERNDRTRVDSRTWPSGGAPAPIYGLEWNEDTDAYARLGAISDLAVTSPGTSAGNARLPIHASIQACILQDDGTVAYMLHPDDKRLKADGTASNLTGDDGQVMVRFEKIYYKYEYDAPYHRWWVTARPRAGFSVHQAFVKDGATVDYRYVGAYSGAIYDASSGVSVGGSSNIADPGADKLMSVSQITPHTNETRATYRAIAAKRGTGWRQLDPYLLHLIQILHAIEYADFDWQETIGNGNTAYTAWDYDEAVGICGLADEWGSGTTASNSAFNSLAVDGSKTNGEDTIQVSMWRGIEDIYGKVWDFVEGNVHNYDDGVGTAWSRLYVSNDSSVIADDTAVGHTLLGELAQGDGYMSLPMTTAYGLYPRVGGAAGASNVRFADYYYTYFDNLGAGPFDDWRVFRLGGYAPNGATAGAFAVHPHYDSAVDRPRLGGRLSY